MTSLVAAVQSQQIDLIPRPVSARRMVCKCGCGRWWWREIRPGRPVEYATDDCRYRGELRREARIRARQRGTP